VLFREEYDGESKKEILLSILRDIPVPV